MINLNSMVNAPEFSSPDAMPRKIDALIVENRELKIAREISEKDWIDILAGLSLGDANDRPRFVAYDESYCLSRRDCAKMAQQLVRHFAPRTAPNTSEGNFTSAITRAITRAARAEAKVTELDDGIKRRDDAIAETMIAVGDAIHTLEHARCDEPGWARGSVRLLLDAAETVARLYPPHTTPH